MGTGARRAIALVAYERTRSTTARPSVARGVLFTAAMKPDKPTHRDANQGEGDRLSARHYNEQLRKFVDGGNVEPAARKAETYVEQMPEAAARAERTARRGPAARGSSARQSLDELVAKARTVADRVRPIVDRAVGKLRARFVRK
jgi:hypothetical protein